jgi:hypothetical protein
MKNIKIKKGRLEGKPALLGDYDRITGGYEVFYVDETGQKRKIILMESEFEFVNEQQNG